MIFVCTIIPFHAVFLLWLYAVHVLYPPSVGLPWLGYKTITALMSSAVCASQLHSTNNCAIFFPSGSLKQNKG